MNENKNQVDEANAKSSVDCQVIKKIAKFIEHEILNEGLKHDNTMFHIKKEALEYFNQLYDYKINFLKELKDKVESNFSL
jgi:hypothetical protein